ncbi:glycosyl hydrolase family 28 protein [Nannocystis pusilla]|uniref:glycosyl hydrolase family 28 protein n=1 Tax=Nannocystis pusilla TaxID=889268 RepID=UPI003DA47547
MTLIVQGNGPSWPGFIGPKTDNDRPRLLQINGCRNVLTRGLSIVDAPNFNLVFKECESGEATDLLIDCPVDSHNTDGLHLNSSVGFKVHDCEIRCGDDAIAITAVKHRECAQHEIWNLKVTGSHGISIGSTLDGDVHDLKIHDIAMNGATNGIRIKSKRKSTGSVADLSYSRFDMTDVREALVIQIGTYGEKDSKDSKDDDGGGAPITGVTVEHVVARGGRDVRDDRRRTPRSAQGLPDRRLQGHRLREGLADPRRSHGDLDRRRRPEAAEEVAATLTAPARPTPPARAGGARGRRRTADPRRSPRARRSDRPPRARSGPPTPAPAGARAAARARANRAPVRLHTCPRRGRSVYRRQGRAPIALSRRDAAAAAPSVRRCASAARANCRP